MNSTIFRSWISRCPVLFCASLLLTGSGEAQPFFMDVTREMEKGNSSPFSSRGTSFGDYNNDGRPDLFFSANRGGRIRLLQNAGDGRFIDRTSAIQAEISRKEKGSGPTWGDYDDDGDLDLFVPVGKWSLEDRDMNMLLRNDRGTFVDVTAEAGLTDVQSTDCAIWLDFDRDGSLDLFVGNLGEVHIPTNLLYRNRGDGTFEDVTEAAGLHMSSDPEAGGVYGGAIAGDFDNDGWPDLFLAISKAFHRLFLNDQEGGFREVISSALADEGEAAGAAAGDFDNDGDLDFMVAAGGSTDYIWRSGVWLNLGDGQFIEVTEGVGLSALTASKWIVGINLGDIDNDGDLDILSGWDPSFLFLNNGDGSFADYSAQSGLRSKTLAALIFGDFDLDGFLDVLGGGGGNEFPALYRNLGSDHHWLRVELAGRMSNRQGIGARLIATSGKLRQTREILGGLGAYQNEMVAHFGLGQRAQVDRLEIRWPSGQVDVLTDISADQKIRIIEGQGTLHVVVPSVWEGTSDSLVVGSTVDFEATVRPALFEADAQIARVTADLSPFGGAEDTPLEEVGDGTYRLRAPLRPIENGIHLLVVMVDQTTSLGSYWVRLEKGITVFPEGDLEIFGEEVAEGGSVGSNEASVQSQEAGGQTVLALQTPAFWKMDCLPLASVSPAGYSHLRFAFHPGNAVALRSGFFSVNVNNVQVKLLGQKTLTDVGIDMEINDWQVVDVPLDSLRGFEGLIEAIRFSGNLEGTLYLDDIRLVAAVPTLSNTAVLEERTGLPDDLALEQNYPNPFNAGTVIRFALPVGGDVELSIFNLAGQQVAKLANGLREAGTYTVRWDGRDDSGRELASGVYLYRLRTGDGGQVEMRKLLLLQ
ncbi:MAG: T9SS type A sorting domain-containing protein [Gemmatimonadetes bacterium]|nr:T9SS type A sorting domain-containing protein [Gemmatimonadota bacterium]